jgi:hypothetical protein
MKKILLILGILFLLIISGCTSEQKKSDDTTLANPASVYCEKQGGKIEIIKWEAAETGICTLPDGTTCEEWAYFRGECNTTFNVDKATKCADARPQICTMDYNPVCGYFSEDIKCIKYPCASTYSNGCGACSDPKVAYFEKGECPK